MLYIIEYVLIFFLIYYFRLYTGQRNNTLEFLTKQIDVVEMMNDSTMVLL